MTDALFPDRREAGRELARRLVRFAHRPDVSVLALPRGGVPVAAEVAAALQAPLDVFVVGKLGVPGQPEYAMGAIASGGARVLIEDVVAGLEIHAELVDAVTAEAQVELARREAVYRKGLPPLDMHGRTVLLVDDGAATGASMRVAAVALRQLQPARIIAAVPVGSPGACALLQRDTDAVVCAETPDPFHAVSLWYDRFDPVGDDEVNAALSESRRLMDALR